MKKDLIFTPIILAVGILLKLTGLPVHIIISALGIVVLVVYTVLTKKTWKVKKLEIAMRAFYGIALITGVVIKIKYVVFVTIIHKVTAVLFVLALIVLFVYKLISSKSKNKILNNK